MLLSFRICWRTSAAGSPLSKISWLSNPREAIVSLSPHPLEESVVAKVTHVTTGFAKVRQTHILDP